METKIKQKMIAVIMGQDCEKYLPMAIESVKDADVIIYCDGGSKNYDAFHILESEPYLKNCYDGRKEIIVLQNKYDQNDRTMNGKQRNIYLNYLKKNYMGDVCIVLDADEVIDNFKLLREFSEKFESRDFIINLKMRHFECNLGHEDATQNTHFVPNRLFRIVPDLFYPEVEHPVLWLTDENGKNLTVQQMAEKYLIGNYTGITIWHLGYAGAFIFDIKRRYENHLAKSNIHSKDYLDAWYFNHIVGMYPVKPINLIDIPHIILNHLGIDPDKIYFLTHCQLELKHFLMIKQWRDYFNPVAGILDIGCGVGLYGYAADALGIKYTGIEKSKWAVENRIFKHLNIIRGDIIESYDYQNFSIVLLMDILEHLTETELKFALLNIKYYGQHFIFSIPFIGDPNLDADPTHKIKKSRDWWIAQLSEHFKIKDAPSDWYYNHQLLIGEPK